MQKLKSKEEFEKLKSQSPMLLVQIGAKTCLPCTSIKNKIDSWIVSHERIKAIYISIEDFPEICAEESVFSVPTVILFTENKRALFESGYFSLDDFLLKCERLEEIIF